MNAKTVFTSLFLLSITSLGACSSSNPATTGTAGAGGSAAGADGGAGTGSAGAGTAGAAGGTAGAAGGTAGAAGGTAGAASGTAGAAGSAAGADGGAAGADGGAAGAAGDAAGADGGVAACNTLQLSGPQIAKTSHAGAAPTMMGGTIALGTYLLTAIDKYNGTQGSNTHRETWAITAGHLEVTTEDSSDGKGVQHNSGSWSTATNMLTLTITCPGAGALTGLYTFADGKLAFLSEPNSTDQEIHTLTKQP
jgi:hypothetical protein